MKEVWEGRGEGEGVNEMGGERGSR